MVPLPPSKLKIFVPVVSSDQTEQFVDSTESTCGVRGLRSVSDIREGMNLVLHDVGTWNVNTTALHSAKVSLHSDNGCSYNKGDSVAVERCTCSARCRLSRVLSCYHNVVELTQSLSCRFSGIAYNVERHAQRSTCCI